MATPAHHSLLQAVDMLPWVVNWVVMMIMRL